ncbi:uncharacterized protein [Bombus flavifrons]|uniref:uncharacterized protein isoform X2 n=1 Tax=Bombus flavifrons TaxID=103934 RepID=UPI00370405AE
MIITTILLEGYYLQLNDMYKYNHSRNLDAPTLLHNHYDDHKVLRSRTNYSLDQRTVFRFHLAQMQASSMNLLAAGLSLFCFVHPLHGDPQGFYSTNYEPYNPAFHISDPVHRVAQFPERYDSSSTRKSLPRMAQYRETSEATPEEDQFEKPLLLLSYSKGMTETVQPGVYNRYSDFGSDDREEKAKEDRINVENGDKKSELDEEAIIEKMRILDRLLSEDSGEKDFDTNVIGDKIISEESKRVVREVKKKKPGLFWSLAKITFEAISDTTSAIKEIATIINNSIAPDSATASTIMKGSLKDADSSNMTNVNGTETTTSIPTTTPFVLTRQALQSLIRRNVLGLVKLFNIEWKDALNQSETNVKEFQRDLGNQIGSFFRDRRDT